MKMMVVKTFDAVRTPCPRKWTVGRLVEYDYGWWTLEFTEPFTDSDGGRWEPSSDRPLRIRFHGNEVRQVLPNPRG